MDAKSKREKNKKILHLQNFHVVTKMLLNLRLLINNSDLHCIAL